MSWVWGVVWMIGAAISLGIIHKMSEADPSTYGDCFSGDYSLDLLVCMFWPLYLAYKAGKKRR
jgi:hypothetical protein